MFMNIDCEISTETIMEKMLAQHSLNYVLYLVLQTYGYDSAEYLADKISKTVEETNE